MMALLPMPIAFWLIYSLASFLNERTVSRSFGINAFLYLLASLKFLLEPWLQVNSPLSL
jgi:hypothetical protein